MSRPVRDPRVAKYATGPKVAIRLPARTGPTAAAPPFKRNSALLAATICAGSSLSFTCETESEYKVAGNFALYELSAQATREVRVWAGRTTWHLRRTVDGLRLFRKVVELVNASEPLPTLAFII